MTTVRDRMLRLGVFDAALVVALVALPAWSLLSSARARTGRAEARVTRSGRLVGVYPLDRDARVQLADDVVVEIRDGRVRVAESDCPKGVCRHAGWVSEPGRSIICVPNRVIVELRGVARGYDAESY
ncbi:MAG: NusG domain II-containing protein [bacterium]